MMDNVNKHLSCTVLLVSFSRGAILQYLVYLVLIVIIFSMLNNHNKRIKASVRINHISLATFAIVSDSNNMCFISDHVSYLHLHVTWVTVERFEFQISWQAQKSNQNYLPASANVGLKHAINHDLQIHASIILKAFTSSASDFLLKERTSFCAINNNILFFTKTSLGDNKLIFQALNNIMYNQCTVCWLSSGSGELNR